jgi:hypothetical protein
MHTIKVRLYALVAKLGSNVIVDLFATLLPYFETSSRRPAASVPNSFFQYCTSYGSLRLIVFAILEGLLLVVCHACLFSPSL